MAYTPGQSYGTTPAQFPGGVDTSAADLFDIPQQVSVIPVMLKRRVGEAPTALDVRGAETYTPEVTKPFGTVMRDLYSLSAHPIVGLQNRLFSGGFYGKKADYADGVADETTYSAYAKAVTRAARAGKTIDEVLDEAKASIDAAGGLEEAGYKRVGEGGERQPLVVELAHPDDIRSTAKQTSAKVLGRGFSEGELDAFVRTYQSMQAESQRAAYGAGETGGTVTRAPSVEAGVEAEARRLHPVEAGATDMAGAFDMILAAVQSLGGGR
jgi:hypothetical protein